MEATVKVTCPKCYRPLPEDLLRNSPQGGACPNCRAAIAVRAYPRLWKRSDLGNDLGADVVSGEGDAVCRFYPDLKAETVCEACGCLLSAKAAVNWVGRSYCLPCLHSLREEKGEDGFLSKRTLYDNSALGLVVFLAPLSLFTTPIALYFLIRYRNASRGIVPRGKFRWWAALLLSVGFSLGWLLLLVLWIAAIVESLM